MSLPAPSRRAVIAGAAWSVPAVSIASASPAFATSPGKTHPCTTFVFDWVRAGLKKESETQVDGRPSTTWTAQALKLESDGSINTAVSRSVIIKTNFVGKNMTAVTNLNMKVGEKATFMTSSGLVLKETLRLQQVFETAAKSSSGYQTVEFNFGDGESVSNVDLLIQDVDSALPSHPERVGETGGFHDEFAIISTGSFEASLRTAVPRGYSMTAPTLVGGDTLNGPWYVNHPSYNTPYNDVTEVGSQLRVTQLSGSISSFTLKYSNRVEFATAQTGNQGAFIGPFTFTSDVCV
ncbi:hypothetical protein [Nocardioides yefusunii]|uniref:Uncharacterized protein n=1 Tax=Nocardioides yefusunii TaxID=2500546 RepID=A0ABW1R1N8_9ACTN|nr:hypothetical protein [Nocardioides yefusunii]